MTGRAKAPTANGHLLTAEVTVPELGGEARAARDYRGGHLQIIACAGAGKTEVVSQRVAGLLADGFDPESLVAFTFTERAAAELKSRIQQRVVVHPKLGPTHLDRIGGMFVGTIHAYCFDILRRHVPRYDTYDVLDDNRLIAFLTRHAYRIELTKRGQPLFAPVKRFLESLDVIENEMIDEDLLDDPFRTLHERYLTTLEEHRFITYGQIIAQAVRELEKPLIFNDVHGPLRHLIVDEYQDVNPAQERLVARLATSPVHLCVVGDDDQSIYQWRGSNVQNIVRFRDRYPGAKPFTIDTNRRSRPSIIQHANGVALRIEGRLEKAMAEHRPSEGAEVVWWKQETPEDEARVIARAIRDVHEKHGYRYRDVAILCRGRVSLPPIIEALRAEGVPVQPGGRTNLFTQPEADLFGRTICWLIGRGWRPGQYEAEEQVRLDDLARRYHALYDLSAERLTRVRRKLEDWKAAVEDVEDSANPVRKLYDLLSTLGVADWDFANPVVVNRLGTLARCSEVISDYESARRRARPDHSVPGEMIGGTDRGTWFYVGLATYVQNWAQGSYEGFEGEEAVDVDAVDLTTIHKAKGLEWPIVFVPALSDKRFPSSKTGQRRNWWISRDLFEPERYEGCVNDERRLFYVAMTRARDFLSLSTFERLTKAQAPSRFLRSLAGDDLPMLKRLPAPARAEEQQGQEEVLEITFSDLASFRACGKAYRLRTLIGFQPSLVAELGYGKAVHHVLREVAEFARARKRKPNERELDRLFDDSFYLPAASKAGHREMKMYARDLVNRYLAKYEDDLHRIWAVERPFELHLPDAIVTGRADVIIDQSNGHERLAIVDYKTRDTEGEDGFQLQVYTDAGRREGLTVDRAFIHDLKKGDRDAVAVGEGDVEAARVLAGDLIDQLRNRKFVANPNAGRCGHCDVRPICKEGARG